ncbi:MAG: stalk domain-containing protein [Tissierellia bacterium]|nr:stalk domain-containing protein [Tissierellia bacterium]
MDLYPSYEPDEGYSLIWYYGRDKMFRVAKINDPIPEVPPIDVLREGSRLSYFKYGNPRYVETVLQPGAKANIKEIVVRPDLVYEKYGQVYDRRFITFSENNPFFIRSFYEDQLEQFHRPYIIPEKENGEFAYWAFFADGTLFKMTKDINKRYIRDLQVYAYYKPNKGYVNVYYIASDQWLNKSEEGLVQHQFVKKGDLLKPPIFFYKPDHYIEGWYKTPYCKSEDKWDLENDRAEGGPLILYANYVKGEEPIDVELTVENGSPSGTFKSKSTVNIKADPNSEGRLFYKWEDVEGDSIYIHNRYSEDTKLYLPNNDVKIKAVYKNYAKIVEGLGSKYCLPGDEVNIEAVDQNMSHKIFVKWETDNSEIEFKDQYAKTTSFTMPDEPVEIRAIYQRGYDLEVLNGEGTGKYINGAKVNIKADIPAGKDFDRWMINTTEIGVESILDNIRKPEAVLTMPDMDIRIYPTYKDVQSITVINGEGSGEYMQGEEITIKANTPPSGQVFHVWESTKDYTVPLFQITMPEIKIKVLDRSGYFEAIFGYKVDITNGTATVKLVQKDEAKTARAGEQVDIKATIPDGKVFDKWINISGINLTEEQLKQSAISIQMPGNDIAMEASFVDQEDMHTLSVIKGSGSGNYGENDTVTIKADFPGENYIFDGWKLLGDLSESNVADLLSPTTTLTMPDKNAAIEATYVHSGITATYELQVKNGIGSGNYKPGNQIKIVANPPESGKTFKEWKIVSGNVIIKNPTSPNTLLSMKSENSEIEAIYRDLTNQSHTLTVNSGSGTGNYKFGEVVNIAANIPEPNYRFSNWEIENGTPNIKNIYSPTTTLTMPDEEVIISAIYKNIAGSNKFELLLDAGKNGTMTASPSNSPIDEGTEVTIGINPNLGYKIATFTVNGYDKMSELSADNKYIFKITERTEIKATFEEAGVNVYKVNFNTNGGSAVSDIQVEEGKTITEPTEPIKLGYNFDGWYKEVTLENLWDFGTDTVTKDITLYAKWTEQTGTQSDNYTGKATAEVKKDATVTIADLKFNPPLPHGAIADNLSTIDTQTVGTKTGTVEVKFGDGSEKIVEVTVTVTDTIQPPGPGANVSLSPKNANLKVGDIDIITATITPADADKTLTWTSSDNSVVTVSNGVITAKKAGSAIITAKTVDGNEDKVVVNVTSKDQPHYPPQYPPYYPQYPPYYPYYPPVNPNVVIEKNTTTVTPIKETKSVENVRIIKLHIGDKTVLRTIGTDKSQINMDVAPFIENGRTMVPIRFVAEALGYKVSWDRVSREATLKSDKHTIIIPVDTNIIKVDGKTYEADVKPIIKDQRTYLSISNVCKALGLRENKDIFWDKDNFEVTIIMDK